MTSTMLVHVAIAAFALATGLGLLAVRRQSAGLLNGARVLAGVAALLLLAVLVRRGVRSGQAPILSRFDTHLLITLILTACALGLDFLKTMPILTIGALPLALASLILAAATGEPVSSPDPVVAAPIAGFHAALVLLAYASFALAFVSAVLYLIEQRQLKAPGAPGALGMMPSLESSYRMTLQAVLWGVALLTAGILAGYLYGRQVLAKPGWQWDAKIIITSAIWIAYLVVAALSLVPSLKGRRTALASALCFVLSMTASWIASFWSGFHRHS